MEPRVLGVYRPSPRGIRPYVSIEKKMKPGVKGACFLELLPLLVTE